MGIGRQTPKPSKFRNISSFTNIPPSFSNYCINKFQSNGIACYPRTADLGSIKPPLLYTVAGGWLWSECKPARASAPIPLKICTKRKLSCPRGYTQKAASECNDPIFFSPYVRRTLRLTTLKARQCIGERNTWL